MKIGISCDTNNQTYDIPDFWNIEFGDKEALAETRFFIYWPNYQYKSCRSNS